MEVQDTVLCSTSAVHDTAVLTCCNVRRQQASISEHGPYHPHLLRPITCFSKSLSCLETILSRVRTRRLTGEGRQKPIGRDMKEKMGSDSEQRPAREGGTRVS